MEWRTNLVGDKTSQARGKTTASSVWCRMARHLCLSRVLRSASIRKKTMQGKLEGTVCIK